MNRFRSPRDLTGLTSTSATAPDPIRMPTAIDLFEKARTHDRVEQLRAAREQDLMPYFRLLEGEAGPVVTMEGKERIQLGSNNYLGLTGDERVKQAARDALERYGTALTGSRFMNGTIPLHLELEREIAEWMQTEDALVFTTGYQANVGCLSTLLEPGDTVICDTGDHASILDGVAELCRAHGARLMVDEAHGVGVLGERGAGASEAFGVEDEVDLRMGTFSKSIASCGGFIAGPADVIDFLRIQSRAFMFTAAAVPAATGAALAAVRIINSDEGKELLDRLRD